MTSESLPAPYDRDPEGWAPRPPHSPHSTAPGRRIAEAQAAHAALFGRGGRRLSLDDRNALPAAETRRLILLAAAASDAAAIQSTHAARYQSVLRTRAFLIARYLCDYDEDHGTSRGAIPAADPRWITKPGDKDTPRAYLRQELAALLDAEAAAR